MNEYSATVEMQKAKQYPPLDTKIFVAGACSFGRIIAPLVCLLSSPVHAASWTASVDQQKRIAGNFKRGRDCNIEQFCLLGKKLGLGHPIEGVQGDCAIRILNRRNGSGAQFYVEWLRYKAIKPAISLEFRSRCLKGKPTSSAEASLSS